jgi:hypothetical protein
MESSHILEGIPFVFPCVCAFGLVWPSDTPSNINNKDNHSQSLSIYSIPTV